MREGVHKDIERRSTKKAPQTTSPEFDKKQQNLHMLEKQVHLHESLSNSKETK